MKQGSSFKLILGIKSYVNQASRGYQLIGYNCYYIPLTLLLHFGEELVNPCYATS